MTVKNDEINWETVQKASYAAVTWARRRFEPIKNADFSEVENELICFILDDKNRKRFGRYIHGDTTAEKVNKLVHAISKDKSWFDMFFSDVSTRFESNTVTTYQLDKPAAKEIVRRVFSGDTIDTEEFHIIADKLRQSFTPENRQILEAVYSKTMTKTEVALHYGIHWRTVYKLINKAITLAQREWVPVFMDIHFREWDVVTDVLQLYPSTSRAMRGDFAR